jgi:hypothetical protein
VIRALAASGNVRKNGPSGGPWCCFLWNMCSSSLRTTLSGDTRRRSLVLLFGAPAPDEATYLGGDQHPGGDDHFRLRFIWLPRSRPRASLCLRHIGLTFSLALEPSRDIGMMWSSVSATFVQPG